MFLGTTWLKILDFSSILVAFEAHFGARRRPKSIKNRSKMDLGGPLGPKWAKASIFDRFLIHFWSTLGSLWEHFLVNNFSKEGIVF